MAGDPIPSRNQNVSDDPTMRRAGGQVVDNDEDSMTAGMNGHLSVQDLWLFEKQAHFNREVIPERRMHAKGWGAWGEFTVTHDITKYTKAKIFSKIGNKCKVFSRMSTVAGERGAADAERDIRGFAIRFYTEEGNWDVVGNNTPVFFFRDLMKFIDLNHAVKRDPKSHLRSPNTNFDYWSSLPELLLQTTIIIVIEEFHLPLDICTDLDRTLILCITKKAQEFGLSFTLEVNKVSKTIQIKKLKW